MVTPEDTITLRACLGAVVAEVGFGRGLAVARNKARVLEVGHGMATRKLNITITADIQWSVADASAREDICVCETCGALLELVGGSDETTCGDCLNEGVL